ncbi:MAG TPA: hypothetical protein VMG60_12000 [Burkholderiaceae bacterium]|nr:hypothetical protein [Burkholderiaceae bacterium]
MKLRLQSLLAMALLCLVSHGRAQIIDEVNWRRLGDDGALQISFTTPIQFLRAVISPSGDLAQAFYEIRLSGETPRFVVADRRLAASDGLPAVLISDEAVSSTYSRKVVIHFDRPVKMRVVAGRGNCCIDVIVEGAGAAAEKRSAAPPSPAAPTGQFMVTLQQSTDPNLRMEVPVPGELDAYQLFTARRAVDGRTVYEINLGYFGTRAEAERALKILAQRFPQATVVEVNPQAPPPAIAAVREPTPQAAPAPAPLPAAPMPPPAPTTPGLPPAPEATPEGVLVPLPAPAPVPVAPVPPSPAPAQPSPPAAPPVPAQPQQAPAPAQPPAAQPSGGAPQPGPTLPSTNVTPPAPAPSAPAEIDQRGRVLLAQGRAAMDKGDFDQAVGLFNQLLNLPPNVTSQEGQELIGFARAKLGDVTRARVEFELYLKLYPTGPGADRVRAGLAQLGAAPAAQERRLRPIAPSTSFVGSFSQYYYGGNSLFSTLLEGTPLPGTPPPNSGAISSETQRLLQTNLDLNYRHRDAGSDLRAVFRDTYSKDFLNKPTFSTRVPNRLIAAYVDYKALPTGVTARVGRQTPTGDGVLYTFDGARLGYTFVRTMSVNAVAGVPVDDLYDAKRRFYGLSLDTENLGDHLSGSVYAIQQVIDGETDRRAVGTELRYFDVNTSLFGIYDFDTLFHAVNIASLQGTWQAFANTVTFSFLADRRTAPILATGNALLQPETRTDPVTGEQTTVTYRTLTAFLQNHSLEYAHQLAKATTAYVAQGLLGASVQVTPNFQWGVDWRLSNTGALPGFDPGGGVTPIPPQPATGNVQTLSGQTVFSNLYSERDTHALSLAFTRAPEVTYQSTDFTVQPPVPTTTTVPAYRGIAVQYNNTSLLWQQLQVEPSFRYYRQDDTQGRRLTRWSPGLRLTWRITQKFSLEGTATYERTTIHPGAVSGTTDLTVDKFYYFGYRYDF